MSLPCKTIYMLQEVSVTCFKKEVANLLHLSNKCHFDGILFLAYEITPNRRGKKKTNALSRTAAAK